jgi:polysaccharide biosynthesis transport protein
VNVNANTPDFAPEAAEGKPLVLADFFRVAKKYGWLIGGVSLIFAVAAYVWSKSQPKQYDATAQVQVEQHGSLSLGSAMGASDEYELKIATQLIAIQSRDVAIKVIEDPELDLLHNKLFNPSGKTDITTNPETRNQLVGAFLGNLEIERVPKTELISVTFRSRSPVLSSLVANKVVDDYMEVNFRHRYQGSKEITKWLTQEMGDLKGKVQNEQSQLLSMELKLGVFSTGITSETSLYQAQLESLLSESIKAQSNQFANEAAYQELVSGNPESYASLGTPGSIVLTTLNVQLAELDAQRKALVDRYGPGYPTLRQLDIQVDALKKNITAERQKILDSALEQANAAKKTTEDIEHSIQTVKQQAQGQNSDLVQFEVLKAQYVADQALYNSLLALLSAGGIEAGLKSQEVNRMTTADIPTLPSRPRVMLSTVAGFGIGFLLSLSIVGVIVAVSDTVETVEQIEEALSLPVLAAVPVYKLDPAEVAAGTTPIVTLSLPRSAAAEAYRILRTSVNLMPVSGQGRVLGFTSCGPGEGKSTTALNLAVALAQQGKRVVLVDADLRKPTLAQRVRLSQPDAPGLSRYLSDYAISPEQCVQAVEAVPGLHVIPVQEIPPFPSELLARGRLEELVAWGRKNFDVMLIDTPPALLVTDALIVAQSLDIILLVARVGVAQRRALRRLREELRKFAEKQIAVVVNAVPQSQSYYGGYGDKHGYYGSTSNGKKKKRGQAGD